MTGDKQRLELAKWLFERTLSWIASSDVKVGVALALDTALIGGLAAAFVASEPTSRLWWCYLVIVLTTIGLVAAMFCAGMAAIPRMLGPVHSMIYFGRIAEQTESAFVEGFSKTSEKAFLDDIVTQIYRNSQIASEKHLWVRASKPARAHGNPSMRGLPVSGHQTPGNNVSDFEGAESNEIADFDEAFRVRQLL